MRPNAHTTDMDFRIIPSAIPLQSPSPDKKNANNITPTVSPSPIELKKNITPSKRQKGQKENSKVIGERSTELKYATHSPGIDYSAALREKEEVIKNLKNIIDLITENGRRGHEETEDIDLKKQVKILTIENQKLVNIIEKMSRSKNSKPEETTKSHDYYEKQISELMNTIKTRQEEHDEQQKELKKLYKALNSHYKNLQGERNELERENQKLLKILKDKNETEKKCSQKSRLSEGSEGEIDKSHKSVQRVSLQKIKEQYSENMKSLREGLIKEIEQTFDTMRIALEGIDSKVSGLAKRLESIQNLTWSQIRKSQTSREEDAKSPIKYVKDHHKSQIYIEQGPESSQRSQHSHLTSKDDFSQGEGSRPSSHELQQQLAKAKAELEELRFKYDKICLDTSTVSYSKRMPPTNRELEEDYEKALTEVANKNKQIEILYEQIKNIEQENIEGSRQKNLEWEEVINQKQKIIESLKQNHEDELTQMKAETQLKVKMLIENYEKQIELLKKQIVLKNADLHESNEVHDLERSETRKQLGEMSDKLYNYESELEITRKKLEQKVVEMEIQRDSWKKQISLLQRKLEDCEEIGKTDRQKRESVQQQIILQMVELNQCRRQLEEETQKTKKYDQKINEMSNDHEEREKEFKNLQREKEQEIEIKQMRIQQLEKILLDIRNESILQQITELQDLLQKEKDQGQQKAQQSKQTLQISQEMEDMRQNLFKTQEKCIQQEAKITQLEGLCEMYRGKFQQLQQAHIQLIQKSKQSEDKLPQKQRHSTKVQFNELILQKIRRLHELEEQRTVRLEQSLQF